MDLLYFDPLLQFGAGICFLFACFLIAALIGKMGANETDGRSSGLVIHLVIALVLLVTGYSLIKTGFHSVNLVYVLALILLFFFKRRSKLMASAPVNKISIKRVVIFSLAAYIFWFVVILFTLYIEYSSLSVKSPDRDLLYYSKLTNQLTSGIEDFKIYLSNADYTGGHSPYHYFEIWLNGLFSNIFHIAPFKSFILLVRVLLLTFSSVLIWLIASHLCSKSSFAKWTYLAPLTLLFKPLILYKFGGLEFFGLSYVFQPKAEVFFLFILLEIWLYLRYNRFTLVGFSFLAIASIVSVPALAAFVSLAFIFQFILRKNFFAKGALLSFLLVLCAIAGFYVLNGHKASAGTVALPLRDLLKLISPKTIFNVVAGNLLFLVYSSTLFFAILLLTVVLNRIPFRGYIKTIWKRDNYLFPLLLLLIICSSVVAGILYPFADSVQTFTLIAFSVLVSIYSYLFLSLFENYKIKIFSLAPLFIYLVICFTKHAKDAVDYNKREQVSANFYNQVTTAYNNNRIHKGGFLPQATFYNAFYDWNDKLSWQGQYLYYINPDLRALNISMDSSLLSKQKLEHLWEESFYRESDYIRFCKAKGLTERTQAQVDYVKEKGVDFLITTDTLPSNLRPLFQDSLVDNISHEKLYLRKQ